MNHQDINLNIRYDAPPEIWEKVPLIYEQMDGWLGYGTKENMGEPGIPYWFGFDADKKHICASVEPSGLQFSGLMDDEEWEQWLAKIKAVATSILGYKVGEIENGEVDY